MCRLLRLGLMLAFPVMAGGVALGVTLWGPAHLEAIAIVTLTLVWAPLILLAIGCDRRVRRGSSTLAEGGSSGKRRGGRRCP
jgi:hypothetical protein